MGTVFPLWSPMLAAAVLALSAPAGAQDNAAAPLPSLIRPANPAPQSPNRTQQQGPELDVFRDVPGTAAQPVVPPPAVTTTAPPIVTPTPAPAPSRPTAVPRTRVQPKPTAPIPQAPPPATVNSQKTGAPPPSTATPSPQETPTPVAPVAPTPPASRAPWGWIGAALALVLAGVIALWLRRRSKDGAGYEQDALFLETPNPETISPETAALPTANPPRRPTIPAQPATDRPWIEIDLAIDHANHGAAGVSIGYRLTLRNRGKAAAIDLMVHALIGQADANQNDLLRAFFAGSKGMPVHSVVTIAPGQSAVLTNDIGLDASDSEPLELDGRLLLAPLLAFDVHYRWDAKGTLGGGRSGSAFIVGPEQVPPTDRLAPFRVDLGPRSYGVMGCRRTALSLTR